MASLLSADGRYWKDDSFDQITNLSVDGWSRVTNLPPEAAKEFAVPLDECPEDLKAFIRENPATYGDGRVEAVTDRTFFVFYIKEPDQK